MTKKQVKPFIPQIDYIKLIHLVRKHECLYNNKDEGYYDQIRRDKCWLQIYVALFPKFESMNKSYKEIIREFVKRRWKTLRSTMAKELRKNVIDENYIRTRENRIIDELQFLIPYIKSVKSTKEDSPEIDMGNSKDLPVHNAAYEDDDLCNSIDLTEELDLKPDIKANTSINIYDNDMVDPVDYAETQYQPQQTQQQLQTTSTVTPQILQSNSTSSAANNWNNDFFTLSTYKEGEFIPPNNSEDRLTDSTQNNSASTDCNTNHKKRSRATMESDDERSSTSGNNTELQAKILQLLSNLERQHAESDSNSEERMFLLSLVSDLRRVPQAKKMLVKAEIVTAIARAID